jgi:hypothetical protein
MATLPGARLFHEGQFEGRKVRLPVFLGRRPDEPPDEELRAFYKKLLQTIKDPVFHEGQWSLCGRTGWPDNPSFQNLVAWSWVGRDDRYLIVVNLSDGAAQGRVQPPWNDVTEKTWRLTDSLSGVTYDRAENEILAEGLYVDLQPWSFHVLQHLREPAMRNVETLEKKSA